MVTFGERLKQLRRERDLTLEDLSKTFGTTQATLSRYENDVRQPKLELISQLADYFGVSVDYLSGKEETEDLNAELDQLQHASKEVQAEYLKDEFVKALIRLGKIKDEKELTPLKAMQFLQEMFENEDK